MPTNVGVCDRWQCVDQRSLRERIPDMLEHSVGGIRLHLEPDEVTVVRSGAVAAPEVVAGDDDDPSLGEELGLTEAGAPRRVQVPVPAVVGAARDRDDDERARWQLLGTRGDDRHAHVQGLVAAHRRGHVDPELTPDHVAALLRQVGAELALQDLPARVERELVDNLDPAGHLVVGDVLACPRDDLVGGGVRSGTEHDECHTHFPEAGVGDSDHRDLGDGVEAEQQVLDLGG